jgi:uncharacterized protein (TIGR01244 family)
VKGGNPIRFLILVQLIGSYCGYGLNSYQVSPIYYWDLRMKNCLYLLLVMLGLAAYASDVPTPKALGWKEFRGETFEVGNLYIGGQPLTEEAMQQLKMEGVGTIVNLRTPDEMANRKSTPIDEQKLSESLDIRYVHLPSGGKDHPYTAETIAAFSAALASEEGKVLLHCNSGHRATHLWVAYLIKEKNMDVNEAVALGRSANFGNMVLEGFLGTDVGMSLPNE